MNPNEKMSDMIVVSTLQSSQTFILEFLNILSICSNADVSCGIVQSICSMVL